MTRSKEVAADISALMRARHPLLWVYTREEPRAEASIFEAAAAAGYIARTWDVAQGVADISGKLQPIGDRDPGEMLKAIDDRARTGTERGAWIMRDLHAWIGPGIGATTCRQLRNLARMLPTVKRESAQSIIVLSPTKDIPAELQGHATVIDWPLPDREEIAALLDATIDSLPDELKANAAPNGTRESAIDAAVGLTGEEAQACYARSLVQLRKIDPRIIGQEKKRVIARAGVLEWFDPLPGGMDAVGGLDVLKGWLASRKNAYSPEARAYGLPAPKGMLLVGVPGCGKSLTAKATATAFQSPLIRVDLGGLKSKYVGESEGNLRKAFETIAAVGKCVVWFDEIEKALAGATQGAADGGVSSDALGAILSWMQDRQGDAFVIATANDISGLPPELLRKGRFDELFFVDLPTRPERLEITAAALRANNRGDLDTLNLPQIAEATDGFTGSEIAALVPDAMFAAFSDGARPITTADLMAAAKSVAPLSKTAGDKIAALRAWADGKARRATTPETATAGARAGRTLDI